MSGEQWEQQMADVWARVDQLSGHELVTAVDGLTEGMSSAVAHFERACARDSTGDSAAAVPLYREALALGLAGERRRRAVVQLASSLRNVGDVEESVRLLRAELEQPADHLDDAVRAFLALALADTGQEREAVSLLLGSLASHLPRYQRSVANYAHLLVEPQSASVRDRAG